MRNGLQASLKQLPVFRHPTGDPFSPEGKA